MSDAMLDAVADAEHHRCRRAQAHTMHGAHHPKPLIRSAFRRDSSSHFVVQNLTAAARQAVKPGCLEPRHDRLVIQPRDEMDVVYLRRGEAVKLKVRILRVERAQEVFVPLDAEIWM